MKNTSKTLDMTISAIGYTLEELIEKSQAKKASKTDLINMSILDDCIHRLRYFNPELFKTPLNTTQV